MSHRTQVILTDTQYDRLKRESERTGAGLGELVRRAVNTTYGDDNGGDDALEESFGAWQDRDFDGAEHVKRLRHGDPGYDRLRREAERSGVGLEELVQRALATAYGETERRAALNAVEESAGIWSDLDMDGAEYVDSLRRGLDRRLKDL